MNRKNSRPAMIKLAAETLKSQNSSDIQKSLAGSVLSQANKSNQTGSKMEDVASKVLNSEKYNDTTKSLAGSVLSQSDKES
jgi:hypothetical protein